MRRCWSTEDPEKIYALKILRTPDEELFEMSSKEFNILKDLGSHKNVI